MTEAARKLVPFAPVHIPAAQALSSAENWPHTQADWQFMLKQGAGVALTEAETLCATALGWRQGAASTVGMVLTAQHARGQGYGKLVMRALMDNLAGTSIHLNATAQGAPLYRSVGFETIGTLAQCQGIAQPVTCMGATSEFVPVGAEALPDILQLDRLARGWDRHALLRTLASTGTLWSNGARNAYTLIRPSGAGHVIGPIVAPDLAVTKSLLETVISRFPESHLRVDTEPKLGLVPWLESHGLTHVATSTIMRHGPNLSTKGSPTVFGLASQAFG